MPKLLTFRALRYARSAADPADLLAPPYDVIDAKTARTLRLRSPYNAVRLVLPEGEGSARYAAAAALLEDWIGRGILIEDSVPAVYVYRQSFESGGRRRSRWSVFAALELSPFEAGEVLPHEETHASPKEDRLALTLACRAQLSAVFLCAADPGGSLLGTMRAAATGAPLLVARTPDGIGHVLWRLEGAAGVELGELAGAGPLLIADGHHRYETALTVRRRLPEAEAAAAVLACVASEADPGLRALPTHRALAAPPPAGSWLGSLAAGFEARSLRPPPEVGPGARAVQVAARVARAAPGTLGLVLPTGGEAALLVPRPRALEAAGVTPEEARIASVVFDRLVLGGTLQLGAEESTRRGYLSYHRNPEEAARSAGEVGAAFLLPPVTVPDLRRVASRGRRLPPKSTYFSPKIPSGLLFRRL